MAYGLKYQSDFYNFYERLVSVKIYKEGYVGSVINVRTAEVVIEVNYQDIDTSVIGTGVRIVIIADTAELTQYEDLLTSLEKQFKCIIEYNSNVVFQGFSICDLNERQFLPYAAITLQFTDYLRRLESYFLPVLNNAGGTATIFALIQESLDLINMDPMLYVNSSLFEADMNRGATDDFLTQTYLDNYMFHSDPTTYDNAYDSLNKALLSFGIYLYSYSGRWVLERQEDILRDGDWLRWMDMFASVTTPDTYSSLKQTLNKQAGDFKYVDESQIIAYESGLKTLILKLQDKQLESFVFNDYDKNMLSVNDTTPDPGTLDTRIWYKYTDVIISAVSYDFRGMSSYIKWTYDTAISPTGAFAYMGLYYEFLVEFVPDEENPTMLTVNFSMTTDLNMPQGNSSPAGFYTRFAIRIDGGPMNGYYLGRVQDPGGAFFDGFVNDLYIFDDFFEVRTNQDRLWSVSRSWDITSDVMISMPNSLPPNAMPGLWYQLGSPSHQKFMIYFFPTKIVAQGLLYVRINYLGDIQVSVTQQKILNKLTYYINADFEKTEEINIDFFDLDNVNFANGPMMISESFDELVKTTSWISTLNATPVPLTDVFAKTRFQNYARTIHRLKSTILYDGYLKPFAVLSDNNLTVKDAGAADYGQNITFILQSYKWDLDKGTYEIDAQEYTDEDLGFDITQDIGGGGGGGTTPPLIAPSDIVLDQPIAGEQVDISWDAVDGAIAYIVQRKPYWDSGYGAWVDSWKTVWEGPITNASDPVFMDTTPMPASLHLTYRIAAETAILYGPYSEGQVIIWVNS
jgi:hypothetical protein